MENTETHFFTTNGLDIWVVDDVRTMVDLRSAYTGEVVTVRKDDPRYRPATITEIKKKPKPKKAKVSKPKVKEASKCLQKYKAKPKKSKHKGIKPIASGKFEAHYWDTKEKINVHLGTFDTEPLALEALESALKENQTPDKEKTKLPATEDKDAQDIKVTGGPQVGNWQGA